MKGSKDDIVAVGGRTGRTGRARSLSFPAERLERVAP